MKKCHFLLIFLILIISGCATLRPNNGGTDLRLPAVGSPNGIQLVFGPLPESISESFPPTVQVDVINNAACDVSGKLWLNDVVAISQGGIEKPISRDLNENNENRPLLGAVSERGKLVTDKKSFIFSKDTGVLGYRRTGATSTVVADTIASSDINVNDKLTLYGKYGWVVNYWVGKK